MDFEITLNILINVSCIMTKHVYIICKQSKEQVSMGIHVVWSARLLFVA